MRLAVPSDGELHEPSLLFLSSCGMAVKRASLRRYTGRIPSLPQVTVLFQRSADITSKVDEGSADIGIVGLDRFLELRLEEGSSMLIMEDLGFGQCDLVIGVPDSWVDVTSMADLADISAEFREQGKDLRIATKYPHLLERFMYKKGVNYFTIVQVSGAIEAAPTVGYADVIGDISSSGTTFMENRLKVLGNGTVQSSQACLIGNREALAHDEQKLQQARVLVERVEGHILAQEFYRITANIPGESPEAVASTLRLKRQLAGLHGPTIAPVYSPDQEGWYSVTLMVQKNDLLRVVGHLRDVGGVSISVFQPDYVFQGESLAYSRLLEALSKEPVA